MLVRIKTIGEYRDAALVLISVDYLLGYFSWSFYAAENDLGLAPALDTQYLIAGALPTLILGIGVALGALQLQFARWTASEPSERRYMMAKWTIAIGLAMLFGGLAVSTLFKGTPSEGPASRAIIIGAYVVMAGALLQGSEGVKVFRWYGLICLWLVVIFVPILMLVVYFDWVFRYVPASLGGPAPRCVVVDVVDGDLSRETMNELVPPPTTTDTTVKRTRKLDLLFSGAELVMVRPTGQRRGDPVFAIDKDAIRAITSCQ